MCVYPEHGMKTKYLFFSTIGRIYSPHGASERLREKHMDNSVISQSFHYISNILGYTNASLTPESWWPSGLFRAHDHIKLTSTISFHSLWGAVATLNLAGDNPGKNMLEKSIPELSAQL